MRIFRRILLTLYILGVMFVAGVVLACAWGIIQIQDPSYWLTQLYFNKDVVIVASVIGVIVILISLMLMFSRSRKRAPKAATIADTGSGGISISLSAIEEMATRHIMTLPAVQNVKVGVAVKDAKVDLSAKMDVAAETNIPETLSGLQASLKENIETLAGIETGKIALLVEKTSQGAKARIDK